jgi:hypothetical protein
MISSEETSIIYCRSDKCKKYFYDSYSCVMCSLRKKNKKEENNVKMGKRK